MRNCDINKMSIRNIIIIFSPTLNIPFAVISTFLTDYDAIFDAEPEPSSGAVIEVSAPSPQYNVFSNVSRSASLRDGAVPQNQDNGGLGVTYDKVMANAHSMERSITPGSPPAIDLASTAGRRRQTEGAMYNNNNNNNNGNNGNPGTVAGPEYGAVQQRVVSSTAFLHGAQTEKDLKTRRRESSMMVMGNSAGRKSSMPLLRTESGE